MAEKTAVPLVSRWDRIGGVPPGQPERLDFPHEESRFDWATILQTNPDARQPIAAQDRPAPSPRSEARHPARRQAGKGPTQATVLRRIQRPSEGEVSFSRSWLSLQHVVASVRNGSQS